ncbi:MAG: hypothetical protein Fur0043_08450 [Anaerolineales bacterium]
MVLPVSARRTIQGALSSLLQRHLVTTYHCNAKSLESANLREFALIFWLFGIRRDRPPYMVRGVVEWEKPYSGVVAVTVRKAQRDQPQPKVGQLYELSYKIFAVVIDFQEQYYSYKG